MVGEDGGMMLLLDEDMFGIKGGGIGPPVCWFAWSWRCSGEVGSDLLPPGVPGDERLWPKERERSLPFMIAFPPTDPMAGETVTGGGMEEGYVGLGDDDDDDDAA
eukprot:CAMPEP_0185732634 /NCGR_PEP_ID=MMETSP1171-20130828/16938_1 /TAXON_ID=374046 /ORGANISM="Helicotheca tamensis, Strain CCMP826" /LENGTH=104 /DNA_ID=CAMNT_0028402173 /DNA_START=136 /DNA_END=446 /DNA_ORIENTATION=-